MPTAKQDDVAPVSGSDDARSGAGEAARDREDAAQQAEKRLRQQGALDEGVETRSHELAMAYLRLGGRRRAILDDNIADTRKWEPDEPEAEKYWQDHIAPLSDTQRKQVEEHLPSVNED